MADSLERAKRLAKILSLVLIPAVLGIGSWMVNVALQQQDVDRQYVELALEILRTDEGDIDPQLRRWAYRHFKRYLIASPSGAQP